MPVNRWSSIHSRRYGPSLRTRAHAAQLCASVAMHSTQEAKVQLVKLKVLRHVKTFLKQWNAAVMVQKSFRAYVARKRVKALFRLAKETVHNVVIIQSTVLLRSWLVQYQVPSSLARCARQLCAWVLRSANPPTPHV